MVFLWQLFETLMTYCLLNGLRTWSSDFWNQLLSVVWSTSTNLLKFYMSIGKLIILSSCISYIVMFVN